MALKVAVLGAAGMLGQRFIELLQDHPLFELSSLVDLQEGKRYNEVVNWLLGSSVPEYAKDMAIHSAESPLLKSVDIAFSALPPSVAGPIETKLAKAGLTVVSKASDHRMEGDVPLIIPEVNGNHLNLIPAQRERRGWKGVIVTNSNCTSTILTMSLKPIHDNFGIENVVAVSMQALSGAGYPGVPSLDIVDNVVPFIKGEEDKVQTEVLKILGTPNKAADFAISPTCTRVQTSDGHTIVVYVKTINRADSEDVKRSLKEFKGLNLPSAPKQPIIVREESNRPQPKLDRYAGRGMSVTVGRVRDDSILGIKYVVLGHNTIRGGAGESILTAELLERQGYL